MLCVHVVCCVCMWCAVCVCMWCVCVHVVRVCVHGACVYGCVVSTCTSTPCGAAAGELVCNTLMVSGLDRPHSYDNRRCEDSQAKYNNQFNHNG